MNPLHPPAILGSIDVFDLIVLLSLIALAAFIVVSVQFFRHRNREMWHQTARLAIEKGLPVPQMPSQETPPPPTADSPMKDIRSGFILIAVGAGIALFLAYQNVPRTAFVGAIPGFIGVALILHGVAHALTRKSSVLPDDKTKDS